MADGAAGVGHVVHQDGHAVFDVSHQHHAVHFIGLLPLFVDESKVDVQTVGDGRHAGQREQEGHDEMLDAHNEPLAARLISIRSL